MKVATAVAATARWNGNEIEKEKETAVTCKSSITIPVSVCAHIFTASENLYIYLQGEYCPKRLTEQFGLLFVKHVDVLYTPYI